MVTNSKISVLRLVYPPISNQEASWLQSDADVEQRSRMSDFYMIGGRAEIKFLDFQFDQAAEKFSFTVKCGDHLIDTAVLDIGVFQSEAGGATVELEAGEKIIRIWDTDKNKLIDWFTTEKLVRDRGQGRTAISGLDRYKEFATYDLLYVGIAKVGDTFDRLVAKGHKARMEILSNEPQRYPGARVTDEIYLFLFTVEPTVVSSYDFTDDIEPFDLEGQQKRIVADAEKAFVSLLKPQYNVTKFKNYPKGADGLYGSGIARYGYLIGESVTFNTAHGKMKGAFDSMGLISNQSDFIFVNEHQADLWISGVDFPSTDPSWT